MAGVRSPLGRNMENNFLHSMQGTATDRAVQALERVSDVVQNLTDRQRIVSRSTNVFFHGKVPSSLVEGYPVPERAVGSICEMRFVNYGDTPATVEVFVVNWRQITKNLSDEYLADPTNIPALIEPSDLILCVTLPPKGVVVDGCCSPQHMYIEQCCYTVPEMWQIRLRTDGDVSGHISGVEVVTL